MRVLDAAGMQAGGTVVEDVPSNSAKAFFVRERFKLDSGFEGTIELASATPFHAIALRSVVNGSGDFSLTPYPPETTQTGPVYFSHLTADPSYSSDILLWNSQPEQIKARLEFFSAAGQSTAPAGRPATLELVLDPGRLHRISLPQSPSAFFGYARLTLVSGTALPSATAVIRRWEKGSPASEAGIPATPAVGEQLSLVADRPGQRTGLAILNPSTGATTVELELLGPEAGTTLPGKVSLTLSAGEKRAFFLNELFPDLPGYVTALLKIKASTNLAVLSLLGITNARGEFLIASITGEPGAGALSAGSIAVMPRFATGGGYRTIIYLLPEGTGQIRFHDSSGAAQPVAFR
jgi:hypothetical protein